MEPLRNSSNNTDIPPGLYFGAVLVGIGYIVIVLFGTIGNALVLFAVAISRILQTSSSVFIVNLAIADLITCITFSLVAFSRFAMYRPYLDRVCCFALAVVHTMVGASIYTLGSIALNRLVLILSPMNYYPRIYQRKIYCIWIIAIWTCALLIAVFPPVVFDVGKLSFDVDFHICRPKSDYHTSQQYDRLLIYGFYPIPLMIITTSYITIYVKVLRHNQRMRNHETAANFQPSSPG